MKTHTFCVTGMHCKACKILIEDIVTDDLKMNASVHLKEETISIFSDEDSEKILSLLFEKLTPHGYSVSREKQMKKSSNEVLWQAFPLGLIILALFIGLQKTGILNFGIGGGITPVSSFVLGLVASVSSCLVVV